jgi:hypothetical protein
MNKVRSELAQRIAAACTQKEQWRSFENPRRNSRLWPRGVTYRKQPGSLGRLALFVWFL